eukprot:7665447-Prorocentrum_lima.AAC.1
MSLKGEVAADVAAGRCFVHQNTDHRAVIMEIKTLCIESTWIRDMIVHEGVLIEYQLQRTSLHVA